MSEPVVIQGEASLQDEIRSPIIDGMEPRRVVVSLNKGFGEKGEEIELCPRDGEKLSDWYVDEQPNRSMVMVQASFRSTEHKPLRVVTEYFNSFRIDRVRVEGNDETP